MNNFFSVVRATRTPSQPGRWTDECHVIVHVFARAFCWSAGSLFGCGVLVSWLMCSYFVCCNGRQIKPHLMFDWLIIMITMWCVINLVFITHNLYSDNISSKSSLSFLNIDGNKSKFDNLAVKLAQGKQKHSIIGFAVSTLLKLFFNTAPELGNYRWSVPG